MAPHPLNGNELGYDCYLKESRNNLKFHLTPVQAKRHNVQPPPHGLAPGGVKPGDAGLQSPNPTVRDQEDLERTKHFTGSQSPAPYSPATEDS